MYVLVSFDLPAGASKGEALAYVHSAVVASCGGLHPAEPMFELDRKSVETQRVHEEREP